MKKLIIAAAVLVGMAANAGVTKGSSWKEIQKDLSVKVDAPQVAFANGATTSYVSVMDVCLLDADTLRTKDPINVYEWSGVGDNEAPEAVGKEYRTTAREYSKVYCEKGKCKTIPFKYDINYRLAVTENLGSENDQEAVLFKKSYSIRSCR